MIVGHVERVLSSICAYQVVEDFERACVMCCSPSKSEVVPEPGRPTAAGSTANFSRTGIGSTLNANMSSVSSHMVGRPRTPSTYNLPRVSTLAAGGGTAGMTSTAGMAASLPRVTSRQLPPVGVSMAGEPACSCPRLNGGLYSTSMHTPRTVWRLHSRVACVCVDLTPCAQTDTT